MTPGLDCGFRKNKKELLYYIIFFENDLVFLLRVTDGTQCNVIA